MVSEAVATAFAEFLKSIYIFKILALTIFPLSNLSKKGCFHWWPIE